MYPLAAAGLPGSGASHLITGTPGSDVEIFIVEEVSAVGEGVANATTYLTSLSCLLESISEYPKVGTQSLPA